MITNNSITYYHKELGNDKLETWTKTIFDNVWVFGGKGSSVNKGYENANDIDVRIPIDIVENTNIFQIGDIIAIGRQNDITKQIDLKEIEFYNVTSVTVNNFGNNPHIHLGGK